MSDGNEEPVLTIKEFVERATPLVAQKYGITLEQARRLVIEAVKDEYEERKRN